MAWGWLPQLRGMWPMAWGRHGTPPPPPPGRRRRLPRAVSVGGAAAEQAEAVETMRRILGRR